MSDIDTLKNDLDAALTEADIAQRAAEAAGEHALQLAQAAQKAREAYDAAVEATLPEQTPAPLAVEPEETDPTTAPEEA